MKGDLGALGDAYLALRRAEDEAKRDRRERRRIRLVERIVAIFVGHGFEASSFPADVQIERVYAGHHQRSDGAWSWELWSPSVSMHSYGSQYPATEIAKLGIEGTVPYTNYTNAHGQTYLAPKGSGRGR